MKIQYTFSLHRTIWNWVVGLSLDNIFWDSFSEINEIDKIKRRHAVSTGDANSSSSSDGMNIARYTQILITTNWKFIKTKEKNFETMSLWWFDFIRIIFVVFVSFLIRHWMNNEVNCFKSVQQCHSTFCCFVALSRPLAPFLIEI